MQYRKTRLAIASLATVALSCLVFSGARATLATGGKIPSYTIKTTDGKTYNLSSMKGKVVLVDFWATWCPPCKAEIPHIQELYSKYGKQGLVVIGVSVGEGKDKPKAFAKSNKMTYAIGYTTAAEGGTAGKKFDFEGIPTTYVIDRKGVIQLAETGFEPGTTPKHLEDAVQRALKAK